MKTTKKTKLFEVKASVNGANLGTRADNQGWEKSTLIFPSEAEELIEIVSRIDRFCVKNEIFRNLEIDRLGLPGYVSVNPMKDGRSGSSEQFFIMGLNNENSFNVLIDIATKADNGLCKLQHRSREMTCDGYRTAYAPIPFIQNGIKFFMFLIAQSVDPGFRFKPLPEGKGIGVDDAGVETDGACDEGDE